MRESDREIRTALHARLRARHRGEADARLVDEVGLLGGEGRIDVAAINGRLEGFEIKSGRDSLRRLPRQAETFGRVFDRVTLVCGERHLEDAMGLVPGWWGIEVARIAGGEVRIVRRRAPRANPGVEPAAVVQLLWREEALGALEEIGKADGLRSKPRRVLWAALAEALPSRALRALVRERLKRRRGWRSDRRRCVGGG